MNMPPLEVINTRAWPLRGMRLIAALLPARASSKAILCVRGTGFAHGVVVQGSPVRERCRFCSRGIIHRR